MQEHIESKTSSYPYTPTPKTPLHPPQGAWSTIFLLVFEHFYRVLLRYNCECVKTKIYIF
jgi:hypothetical protein